MYFILITLFIHHPHYLRTLMAYLRRYITTHSCIQTNKTNNLPLKIVTEPTKLSLVAIQLNTNTKSNIRTTRAAYKIMDRE